MANHQEGNVLPVAHPKVGIPKDLRLYSVAEASAILCLTERTVRQMMHRGELAYVRVSPRRLCIAHGELKHFIAGRTMNGQTTSQGSEQ